MITRAEAEALVLDRLNKDADDSHRAAVLDAWLKPYGWVIFYDSELYAKTRDDFDRFFGNGPFVVMHDGILHTLGTSRSAEAELAAFEHARGLASGWRREMCARAVRDRLELHPIAHYALSMWDGKADLETTGLSVGVLEQSRRRSRARAAR